MKNFITHARSYIFRGLLAIIPILLCGLALYLLYNLIDKKIIGYLNNFIQIRHIPGLGILLVLLCLYFIGLIVGNFLGHQLLKFIESVSKRIPLINTIYSVGKQLSQGLSAADEKKQAFQKAVLIKLDNNGLMVPAFVTGSKIDPRTKEELLFVLIPTAPTPASGFVFVVKASQTLDPGWTVEECLKAIVSVGIITPANINLDPLQKIK